MFRHVVLFRWAESTTPEQVDHIVDLLLALPAVVPAIRSYSVGRAVSGSHDLAIVAEFDDEAGWRAYDEHPDHAAVRDLILAVAADRAVVRYET